MALNPSYSDDIVDYSPLLQTVLGIPPSSRFDSAVADSLVEELGLRLGSSKPRSSSC